jgi:hypothetical protein
MKKILFLFFIIIICGQIFAETRVTSFVEKRKIGIQDILKLTIEITDETSKQISQPELPNIPNFSLIGTSSSHSSSMQVIGGKMTSNVTVSYTYQLRPQKTGSFFIPPIRVTIRSKHHVTEAISIEVVEGSTESLPPSASGYQRQQQPIASEKLEDNLFVVAEVSNYNVYRGEPLTVQYRLYTRHTVTNLSFLKEPEFSGFWRETISRAEYTQFQRAQYQGQMFQMMPLISIALFPTASGEIVIPPLEMTVDVRTEPRSFFDFGSTRRFTIANKPLTINVKELPTKGQPANFNGAIGSFRIKSNISNDKMKVGDSFTYTLEISGRGNIAHFEQPSLPIIEHMHFLNPEITTTIYDDKLSGVKTVKYLVIAQEKGKFTLPSLSFTYFDTNTEKYETLTTLAYPIEVEEGAISSYRSMPAQIDIPLGARDIQYIVTTTNLKNNPLYFSTFTYWFICFLILLTVIPCLYIAKEQTKSAQNLDYIRQKQAAKILKKYLKEASANSQAGNIQFYANAQNGLNSYLADKCKIPRGTTTDSILENLKKMHLDASLIEKVEDYFQTCNQARFMPGGFSTEKIKEDYRKLKEIVQDLSKWKRGIQ